MNVIFKLISILVCISGIGVSCHAEEQQLYQQLDELINRNEQIKTDKLKQIETIKQILRNPTLTDVEQYAVNDRLYNEYSTFKYDSAFTYASHNIKLAVKMNDQLRANLSRLNLIHIMSVAGIFDGAEDTIKAIDANLLKGEVLIKYYRQLCEFYLFKSEFSIGTEFYEHYMQKMQEYRKLIIAQAPKDSYDYISTLADYKASLNDFDESIKIIKDYLPKLTPDQHQYGILTSQLAFFYKCKKDQENQKRYLLLSAISDQIGCIKEENSLRELALLLFEEGNYKRAYNYLNRSIDNANFYGTRLRNIQASRLVPDIIDGYNVMREKQHESIVILVIAISVIAIFLIISIIIIYNLLKRYKKVNQKIADINDRLQTTVQELERTNVLIKEANKIKEEYIGRFMELSSTLIEKTETSRKLANRYAKEHNLKALYDMIKSDALFTENTKLFYQNFDIAFLSIYPDFVDKVNELLNERYQIMPKKERLTTELRILALIRLGITDNHKIASILNSSITTIYTYRSRLKMHSTIKDNFEQQVMQINSWE